MGIFEITANDLLALKKLIRSGAAGHEVIRAMTLLLRHKGQTRAEVADVLDITTRTVTNICSNYSELGYKRAIQDDPRPGQPIKYDDSDRAQIIALVCADPPEGFDRWTLELLRNESIDREIVKDISKEQIRIILSEHDLKPWQQKMWCIPKLNEEYIARMEDILDLYEKEKDPKRPLVCVDEKPVILFEDKREPILMSEGSPKKVDYEYKRNGSVNVFVAVEPKEGVYTAKITNARTGIEFAHFLKSLSEKYSAADSIDLVMDNLNTHKLTSLEKAFGEKVGKEIWDRFTVHYTPVHASWLNQAEIAIGMYARQCLGKTRIATPENLIKKTKAWLVYINDKKVTINWKFKTKDARDRMGYGGKD